MARSINMVFWTDIWDMELFWSEAIWAYGGDIINADHTKTLIGEGGRAMHGRLLTACIKKV